MTGIWVGKCKEFTLWAQPWPTVGDEAKNMFFVNLITQPQMNYCLLRIFHIYQMESNVNKPDFYSPFISVFISKPTPEGNICLLQR